jgi:hypothetical protein
MKYLLLYISYDLEYGTNYVTLKNMYVTFVFTLRITQNISWVFVLNFIIKQFVGTRLQKAVSINFAYAGNIISLNCLRIILKFRKPNV